MRRSSPSAQIGRAARGFLGMRSGGPWSRSEDGAFLLASECRSVIEFRVFRNTDPPRLAEVWRSQVGHFELMQPMSMAVLERYVLSKPVFDRQGLIIAHEADKVVGFAHAGFGPSEDQNGLSMERGVTSLVMLRPEVESAVAGELLARSEEYLRTRGAVQLFGGGNYPLSPFYYGLYGGSEFSGVLHRDARMQTLFRDHGYQELRRTLVFHRELSDFRPVVDRQQLKIRRQFTIETIVDPSTTTWWEAVMFEPFERTRCLLVPKDGGAPQASVSDRPYLGLDRHGAGDLEHPGAVLLGTAHRALHQSRSLR